MSQQSKKVILLGDSGVGKTCIAYRLVHDDFDETTVSTVIGNAYHIQRDDDGNKVDFMLWDTAGQERYQSITPIYFSNSALALITYDLTSMDSFTGIKKWVDLLREHGPDNIKIILVGNKTDLENTVVSFESAQEQVKELGANDIVQVSAKTGEAFHELIHTIYLTLEDVQLHVQHEELKEVSPDKKKGCC